MDKKIFSIDADNKEFSDAAETAEEYEMVELAGYQVTKAELFAHSKDPAITVWEDRIKFNMACIRRFPK